MQRIIIIAALVGVFASCAPKGTPLAGFGDYEVVKYSASTVETTQEGITVTSTREYGTGGVGLSLCMLHPNLQLLGIDATVIKEAGLGFNVCRFQDLYVGQVSDRVCKVDAYSEDIYLGLFGLGRDACSTEGE